MSDGSTGPPNASALRRALLAIEDLQARLEAAGRRDHETLALVGLGCRLPGEADSPDALWRLLWEGRDAIGEMPADRWDVRAYYDPEPGVPGKIYTTQGGFLRHVDRFDAAFFGISPREATHLDPQQRLLLEVAWEALEQAGIPPLSLRGSRTGVYVGQATYDYAHLQVKSHDPTGFDAYFATGTAASVASGRLSYTLGLHGPALTIDTACSSSLVALHLACQALRRRECDLALVGGVNLILSPEAVISMCQSRMMAPDGRCKTFAADADGFGQAEGCAVVVVKRLSDAIEAGDTIVALIRGSAVNQDGASSGLTAPSGPAQEAVIRAALKDARLSPDAVAYVEAHGTGTPLGDPIEIQALSAVFGCNGARAAPLLTGSIKTNLGHLEAAAGLAGLLKVALALQGRQIPAHLHFETPSPFIAGDDSAVRVADRLTPFPEIQGRRIAGVSSFGFSGTNAHVLLEQAPPASEPDALRRRPPLSLLTLSARSGEALRDLAHAYIRLLSAPNIDLAEVAFSANTGRSPMEHRLALIAGSAGEAQAALEDFVAARPGAALLTAVLATADAPRVVFRFNGDSARRPATIRRVCQAQPVFRDAFEACEALFARHRPDLTDRLLGPSADPADDAATSNHALLARARRFATEWAMACLWRARGIQPGLVIGHGVGEYVAACLSGVFSLEDAVALISAPSSDPFEAIIRGVRMADPSVTFVSSLTGRAALRGEINTAGYWRGQGRRAGRGADSLRAADALGYRVFLELGPEPVQTRFATRASGAERLCLPTLLDEQDPSRTDIETLARLFLDGAPIDWAAVDAPYAYRRVQLPTYPFQRTRFWLSPASPPVSRAPDARTTGPSGHPHLTRRTDSALGDIIFETRLEPNRHPYLADHVVQGAAILPAAFYLELMASTMELVFHRHGLVLENLVIHEQVLLPVEGCDIQLILTPSAQGGQIQVFADASAKGWRRAVTGDYVETAETSSTLEQAGEPRRAGMAPKEEIEPHQFYDALRGVGLAFGPAFRRVTRLRRRDDEAESEIEPLAGDLAGFSLHPAVLDACLQTLAAALPGFGGEDFTTDVYMPIAIDRFELRRPATGRLRSLAWLDPSPARTGSAPAETRTGHVIVTDPSGNWIARVGGVRMKRADARTTRPDGLDPLVYEIEWRPADLATGVTPSSLATVRWQDSASALEALYESLRAPTGLVAAVHLEPSLDALCIRHVLNAFSEIGWRFAIGRVVATAELALDTAQRHHRLLRRLLSMLAEDGYLQHLSAAPGTEHWRVLKDMTPPRSGPVAADLVERFPDFRAEILFAERGGRRLAAALQGQVEASDVLFPDGSFELADELYRRSPAALVFNRLAAAAVTEAVRRAPSDGPLRVLEIGGGTGGVTSAILPNLPAERTTYEFTDLSSAFFKKASADFAAFPFVRYRTLDIERAPRDQGFRLQDYDLIIASNVLHATNDLSRALDHVRSLLAPGGQLLCLEGLEPRRWIDLSFGLTSGWWNFSDSDLRRDYPLLPAADWRRLLVGKGFAEPVFTPGGGAPRAGGLSPSGSPGPRDNQALILTSLEHPATSAPAVGRTCLIFADRGGVANTLVAKLKARGWDCLVVRSRAEPGADQPNEWVIDRDALKEYQTLFEALKGRGRRADTVVFLWPLDCEIPTGATLDQVDAPLHDGCVWLLNLLQAQNDTSGGAESTLWLVTRCAQHVVEGDRLTGLLQAGLLGFGKVIGLELPEISCRRFDLQDAEDVGALADELKGPQDEPLVAVRDGRRYIARLARARRPSDRRTEHPASPRQLEIIDRGAIEGLKLRGVERARIARNDVEIEVRAAGLNFRDVLNVLGAREDSAALGGEVAGVISRLGAGVTGLSVGQAVVAVTSGGLGDFAVAPDVLVLEKPRELTFEQAAASPLAFLTAHYALDVRGKMTGGERVLIHAAAGGVGMAAVQLARRAGLEVFATAGSETKREGLRALGVRHVFDSRSLTFAADVARETNGEGVDLVLSAVTGPAIAASLKLLRPGGRFLEIGKAEILLPAEVERINPAVRYQAIDLAELIAREPRTVRQMFVDLLARLSTGVLQPLPVETFPLDDAHLAFTHMARARHVGKVVLSMATGGIRLRSDGTYLVSGGLTGLGLASARRLAERGAGHLVLFGRRPPSDDALAVIDGIRQTGARVTVVQADVSSESEMRRLFQDVLTGAPPLRGVIHSAGCLADAVLMQQTRVSFAAVFAPKAKGAWVLHQMTADSPLDFFVMYSSAAAVLGAPGQSNHAAANAVLDGLAHYRRARGLPALSINWGAWADIGAAAERNVARRIGKRGVGDLSVEEGLGVLERLLTLNPAQACVIRADWPRVSASLDSAAERPFLERLAKAPPDAVSAAPSLSMALGAVSDVASASPEKRAGLLMSLVRRQVGEVLGAANPDALPDQQPFRDMGLDSLMSLELRTRLKKTLSLDAPLPATMAFDYPSIAAVVDYLMTDVYGWSAPAAAPLDAPPDRRLLDDIEAMSDEDVDRLLAVRARSS
jgi:acyl transferase domain-containing protein/NADPH:quinone reductase-like Zn-dependent oxidoreductase/SAM-dependent methyltransferase/acyl carrier protein